MQKKARIHNFLLFPMSEKRNEKIPRKLKEEKSPTNQVKKVTVPLG